MGRPCYRFLAVTITDFSVAHYDFCKKPISLIKISLKVINIKQEASVFNNTQRLPREPPRERPEPELPVLMRTRVT